MKVKFKIIILSFSFSKAYTCIYFFVKFLLCKRSKKTSLTVSLVKCTSTSRLPNISQDRISGLLQITVYLTGKAIPLIIINNYDLRIITKD